MIMINAIGDTYARGVWRPSSNSPLSADGRLPPPQQGFRKILEGEWREPGRPHACPHPRKPPPATLARRGWRPTEGENPERGGARRVGNRTENRTEKAGGHPRERTPLPSLSPSFALPSSAHPPPRGSSGACRLLPRGRPVRPPALLPLRLVLLRRLIPPPPVTPSVRIARGGGGIFPADAGEPEKNNF